jgi:hypothetical protein
VRVLVLLMLLMALTAHAHAATDTPAQACVRAVNDDTVHDYDPALHDPFVRAFHRQFPQAPTPPDALLQSQAHYRCMAGKLYGCFIGANLPCSRINTDRSNPGATAFCEDNADADVVPMAATGHDTAYNYRCRDGQAEVTGTTFKLDSRGFATDLWTRLN